MHIPVVDNACLGLPLDRTVIHVEVLVSTGLRPSDRGQRVSCGVRDTSASPLGRRGQQGRYEKLCQSMPGRGVGQRAGGGSGHGPSMPPYCITTTMLGPTA